MYRVCDSKFSQTEADTLLLIAEGVTGWRRKKWLQSGTWLLEGGGAWAGIITGNTLETPLIFFPFFCTCRE